MSNRVVIRNGKPGFIINGKFVQIPDGDNVNTTNPRVPRDDMSGLEAIQSIIKNTFTGKGAEGIKQDATKPNPNYVGPGGGRPKVTQDPDEYFGTGDYGSGGPKEKPKQRSADIRGGDDKVDGYGNPKIDYTKPQTQSIQVVPFNKSNTDTSTSDTSTSDTTSTPIPKSDPNVAVSPRTGEKTKFERRLPTTAELKAAQAARKTSLASGASKREAEYQAVKAGVAASKNPTTAVTGGVNPRQPIMNAYDLVLDYLLSEGHVDTVEEAHYVMLQMTSEHVQEVVEAYVVTLADKKGNTKAYQNYKSGMKNKITGEPLYKAAPHLKGV